MGAESHWCSGRLEMPGLPGSPSSLLLSPHHPGHHFAKTRLFFLLVPRMAQHGHPTPMYCSLSVKAPLLNGQCLPGHWSATGVGSAHGSFSCPISFGQGGGGPLISISTSLDLLLSVSSLLSASLLCVSVSNLPLPLC